MKKGLFTHLILVLVLTSQIVFAEDWDDLSNVERMWDGQKTITNQEYEQVIDALQEKKDKANEKQNKKKFRKIIKGGNSLHKDMDYTKEIHEFKDIKKDSETVIITFPVDVSSANTILEKGFYKIVAQRGEDKKPYVNLYQSQFLVAKIDMTETKDDFGKDILDFAEIIPYDENFVKLIFGSIDFNGYAFLPIIKTNSENEPL